VKVISQAALARRLGITRQAVRDARIHGRIEMQDGKVLLDSELTQAYIEAGEDRLGGRKVEGVPLGKTAKMQSKQKLRSPKVKKVDKKDVKPASKPQKRRENVQIISSSHGEDTETSGEGPETELEFMSKHGLDKMKVLQQVIDLKVKTEEKRRKLVSAELSAEIWGKVFAVHTAELGPLGEKIAADIAATLGVEDAETVLEVKKKIDAPIYISLRHIQRILDDYLESIGQEMK
jgi:hypothetical protein